jgi:hypothetical protein
MILSISYHKRSEEYAQAQIDHIKRLCGKIKYPILFIVGEGAKIDYKGVSDCITEKHVDFSNVRYPFICNQVFSTAAEHAYHNKLNFLWLETDCLVLRPDFIQLIETELLMSGKRAVLTACSNPPHDIISGVGAYRHDVYEKCRSAMNPEFGGWDGALVREFPNDIRYSSLIYHKYGDYDADGKAHPFKFDSNQLVGAAIAHKMWSLEEYDNKDLYG